MAPSGDDDHPERMTRERRCERNKEIVRLCVEEGLPPEDIAARFGLRPSTVFAVLARHSVTVRRDTMHRRARDRRDEAIADLHRKGLSLAELGNRFGLAPATVSGILRKLGVSLRRGRTGPPQYLKERSDEMVRLYTGEGLTLRQLSERFGISHERARQILMKAGVVRRRVGVSITPDRVQELARLYSEGGLTLRQLGGRFDISGERVSHILEEAGVRPRRIGESVTPEGLARRTVEAVRLYVEERLSLREIATRLGLTHPTVIRTLERAGVRRRSSSKLGLSQEELAERNEQIRRLCLEEGLTNGEIERRLGLTRQIVIYALRAVRPGG